MWKLKKKNKAKLAKCSGFSKRIIFTPNIQCTLRTRADFPHISQLFHVYTFGSGYYQQRAPQPHFDHLQVRIKQFHIWNVLAHLERKF